MTNPPARQKLEINNDTKRKLEVYVEVVPDIYLLEPGDRMVIEADLAGAPFTVNVLSDGRLQVYPGDDCDPPVTINGELAQLL